MGLKRFKQFTWLFTFLFLVYGFQPFKFPQFSFDEKTELLINSPECTCCPEFFIVKGELKIPEKFKNKLPKKIYELTIEKNHELKKLPWDLLKGSNEFIVTGTVIGVDSNYYNPRIPCNLKAILKVEKWRPTEYRPYLLSFEIKWIIRYFYTGIGLIIISLVLIFIRSKKRNK
ncbi:MAG: hypothetical protein ACK46Y_10675 [Fluviicola sp.]